MPNLFIIVHAILKEGRPFTEYKYQVKLAQGVDNGKTYLNQAGAVQFAKAVNDNFMAEFAKKCNEATFFSIILDESTDSSRMDQCILLIRYSIKGNAKTKFLLTTFPVPPLTK